MTTNAPTAPVPGALRRLLTEATTGPERSGVAETLAFHGARIEGCASRDWGLSLSRDLPDGTRASRLLTGAQLDLDEAVRACADLADLS